MWRLGDAGVALESSRSAVNGLLLMAVFVVVGFLVKTPSLDFRLD